MRLAVVILAAGAGTRMRSQLPKVLHPLVGQPMLAHALAVANQLEAVASVVVLAPDTHALVQAQLGSQYQYVVQPQPLGTGHAALQARQVLLGQADDVLILFGDTPLLRPATAGAVVAARRAQAALLALLSFRPSTPTGYGRVVRDAAGQVIAIVEERNATEQERAIGECNSGVMCVAADWLWQMLPQVPRNPVKGEYYLTDLIAMAVEQQGTGAVVAHAATDEREAWGINDRSQLAEAEAVLQQRILADLFQQGVTIRDPHSTYVDSGVQIGQDSVLLPGTFLQGQTQIGRGCVIGPYTTLRDTHVGDGAQVVHSVLEATTVPPETVVGPFVYQTGKAE